MWVDGSVSTINLAEFRYVAARYASPEAADSYIADLRRMGVNEYAVDSLWKRVSELKTGYTVALGDAYALAAAAAVGGTLLVGADDDCDVFADHEVFGGSDRTVSGDGGESCSSRAARCARSRRGDWRTSVVISTLDSYHSTQYK